MPNEENWKNWDASPLYAPEEIIRKAPKAFICVSELDIIRDEGIAYANRLKAAGVEVELKMYERAPHMLVNLDGM